MVIPRRRSAALSLLLCVTVGAQQLTDAQIDLVSARLADASQLSWELGTYSQAILELNATVYSVFSKTSLPAPKTLAAAASSEKTNAQALSTVLSPFFNISRSIVTNRAKSNNNTVGPQPLISDGSAADPASIGVSVLVSNWTGLDGGSVDYGGAAKDQLDFLLQKVPKTSDGAISHRVSQVQLWNDFIYMVPPFLAYYGVVTRNRTLVAEGYNQIQLYRNYLLDPQQGMWKHILLGMDPSPGNDPGFWSTGNGWAAMGMLRVQATIKNSEFANTFKMEQKNLTNWVNEIHNGVYKHLDNTNLFTNYADQPATAQGNFYDASSTALLAASVYRTALLNGQRTSIPFAERSRMELSAPATNSSSGSPLKHFTADGYLTPVVNPHSFGVQGEKSAEGQAFVVMMHAAWKEWVQDGSKTVSSGRRRTEVLGWELAWVWVVLCLGMSFGMSW